jgi:eukaryotic-like serine/threonine-protein kinase
MWTRPKGEIKTPLSDVTTGSNPTDDPNATIPQVSFGPREPRSAGGQGPPGAATQRYRILGPLGEGGMGIVYRAEDTRLGRTVAIKTIPAERTADRRAKERFLNEARAASTLDHPNLCTIYEIEETPGGQLYLFMPCYDGETLRDRLKRGPLPLREAIHFAQQVARGLAKAHRQGIVHCDIKPANLMLTSDGVVKILDFGIARLTGQAPSTQAGPSGTPKYRSPEQARGDEVDAPSDIWSLGMVLFEMVTGQPPRRDEHGSVLWEESARMPPEAPPELGAILSRMLADRPADRHPHAAALLTDLDRLEDLIRGVAKERRVPNWRQWLLAAGVGIVACVAIVGGYFIGSEKRPVPVQPTIIQLTDFPGKTSYPSLSPDGSTVLYVRSVGGRSHIFAQATSRGAAVVDLSVNSPADDTQPAFSPDGKQIAFRSERDGGGIFLMPAHGGKVRRLTDFCFHPAWSPNGKEIACSTASIANPQNRPIVSEVFRLNVATRARRRITHGDAAQPSWSPHGQRIAYWSVLPQTGRRVIWTVAAEGGAAIPVIDDGYLNWSPVWSPDGLYLYFASDRSGVMNLWRVPIDEGSGHTRGDSELVTTSQQACILPSLSHDGRQIAYASDGSRTTLEKVGFDPVAGRVTGSPTVIVSTSGVIASFDASPDGRWLTYQLSTPREDLFNVRPDGSDLQRIIGDEHKNRLPRFSPDSSHIAFYSNRSGKYEIWTIGVKDHRLIQETSIPGGFVNTPLWSPIQKMLACEVAGREALLDLTRPLRERFPIFLPLPDERTSFVAYSWSADGKWLAGERQRDDGSHIPGISLYSLVDKKYINLTSHGGSPLWLHDNLRLLYFEDNRFLLLDSRTARSKPVITSPAGSTYKDMSLSPDDRVLYFARKIDEGYVWLLRLGDKPQGSPR